MNAPSKSGTATPTGRTAAAAVAPKTMAATSCSLIGWADITVGSNKRTDSQSLMADTSHPIYLLTLSLFAGSINATVAAPLPQPGSYQLHPALEMSLFASEPQIVDPVALTWDEQGRMYVVEMRDYPY